MAVIKRALISCFDKKDLGVFARELAEQGVELLASGGTADFLKAHKLKVKTVEEFTEASELLDGRVKTLHPRIYGGILALRDHPGHMAMMNEDQLIDLVVVNLYPFDQAISDLDVTLEGALECIDIGGVALLRAAAKNFAHVGVVSDPKQYPAVLAALKAQKGELPVALTRELAVVAFRLTSVYDQRISSYLGQLDGGTKESAISVVERQRLRYGENPHQQGSWYTPQTGASWGLATLEQLQGKELSYNNLLDVDASVRCLMDFEEPTCIILKHSTPCGLSSAKTVLNAYERAHAADPESAFGGIVACNREVDGALAASISETFMEVVVAPEVTPEARNIFSKKKHLRVLILPWPPQRAVGQEWRQILGGWLIQDPDVLVLNPQSLKVVTKRKPSQSEREDLLFAWRAVKHAKSNAVVLAKDRATVGIGQGQPSRVGAVRVAIHLADERVRKAVAASDAFFPFPDGVERLGEAGVSAVIQPGGSIRDQEVIKAADKMKMAMIFTGIRHFRH